MKSNTRFYFLTGSIIALLTIVLGLEGFVLLQGGTPEINKETIRWELYSDPEVGFQIKYPGDVSVRKEEITGEALLVSFLPPATINRSTTFSFSGGGEQGITIIGARNFEQGYGFAAKEMAEAFAKISTPPMKTSEITIGDSTVAYKAEPESLPEGSESSVIFYIFLDGKIPRTGYTIIVSINATQSATVDKILETFTFIEASDISAKIEREEQAEQKIKTEINKQVQAFKNSYVWYKPTYLPSNVRSENFEESVEYDTLNSRYICQSPEIEILPGEKRQVTSTSFIIRQTPLTKAKDYVRLSGVGETFKTKEVFEKLTINSNDGIYYEPATGYNKILVWETNEAVIEISSTEDLCPQTKEEFIKVAQAMKSQK